MRVALITVAMAAGVFGSNIMRRQDSGGFTAGDFGACDSSCLTPANAVSACPAGDATCICTPAISTGLQACANCAATTPDDTGFLMNAAQTIVNLFSEGCADSGVALPTLATTSGTATATATGTTTSGTATRPATTTATRPATTATATGRTTGGTTTTSPRSTGTTTTSANPTTTSNAAVNGKSAMGVFALVAPLVVAGVAL